MSRRVRVCLFLISVLVTSVALSAEEEEGNTLYRSMEKEDNNTSEAFIDPGWSTEMNSKRVQQNVFPGRVSEENSQLSPGMEVIEFGKTNIVAPKGTKVYKKGSEVVVEGVGEYMARRFEDVEVKLKDLAKRQEYLGKRIEELNAKIAAQEAANTTTTNVTQ